MTPSRREPRDVRRAFAAELLAALALHSLLLLWFFRAPLTSGGVDSAQARPSPTAAQLSGFGEMVYELLPALATQARLIRSGVFPSWTPLAQGGTPLIGKMQNAVFAPYHLALYLLPAAAFPWALTVVQALKALLGFAFAYLYARFLGLRPRWAFLSAELYVFSEMMIAGGLFSWFGAGIALPLLLLLAEARARGDRRLFRAAWPWAVAWPFFAGHFEGAVRIAAVGGLYLAARLRQEDRDARRLARALAEAAALTAAGAALAAVQIIPALEYVRLSFNNVWHSNENFAWSYDTISKHLSLADAPALALGLAAAALCAGLFRGVAAAKDPWSPRELARKAAAALALAVAVAALANVGLDDSLVPFVFLRRSADWWAWTAGFALVSAAVWTATRADEAPAFRVLGGVLAGSLLVDLKTPPLSNLLASVPPFHHFHNTHYYWEFTLAAAVLGARALERCAAPAPAPERRRRAARALAVSAALACGWLLSRPLAGQLARALPTGVPTHRPDEPADQGGFMGPELKTSFDHVQRIDGWLPSSPPVTRISFGGTVRSRGPRETLDMKVRTVGPRSYFSGKLVLPDAPGDEIFELAARAVRADGMARTFHGPVVGVLHFDGPPALRRSAMALGLLVFPAVLLAAGPAAPAAGAAALLLAVSSFASVAIPPGQIPYPLPGIDRILRDPDSFRVTSLDDNFLKADYAGLYGLADLRTGGDNLDVYPMIHFSGLSRSFLGRADKPAFFELGLILTGMANGKYLIEPPGPKVSAPGLETFYEGPDMTVYRNKRFRPRAQFYETAVLAPYEGLMDWKSREAMLAAFADGIAKPGMDWTRTVLLQDEPRAFPPSTTAVSSAPASIRFDADRPDLVRLSVDAPRPGFVQLADNLFPGWLASVNGAPVPTLRSWLTFRTVQVPAGHSEVTFVYRSLPLALAGTVSILLALASVVLYGRAPLRLESVKDEAGACAAAAELLLAGLAGASLLFWLGWTVFSLV